MPNIALSISFVHGSSSLLLSDTISSPPFPRIPSHSSSSDHNVSSACLFLQDDHLFSTNALKGTARQAHATHLKNQSVIK
ncbi:uncharacterized protein FOMMEDRAFT_161067 [Fomitiporia mediterranea MF3/22]|uniref:uncharacterized protein n=1 Tax=Fomitiporia mediterranea (strain MF3/22) TaxID=694068 RepID=UPI0004408923|nr:uncharacterized protein FOMMEDRAFT_161067 [Fomitiporia mediterranea MF3/22]EJC98886.1 hypothetical protein FOMMEDRAFT_161067 [Fomitiporia mediterranea MF3/22]